MSARNQMAQSVLNDKLEQVPVAAHHPIIPHCGDPYCPYHCPTPLWFNGMAYEANGYEELEQLPPTESEQGGATPLPPAPDAATHEPMRNFVRPDAGPRETQPPTNSSIPGIGAEPPPVTIDSAARIPHRPRRNYAIRRLPHISQETDPRQLAPVAAPYIHNRRSQPPSLRLFPGDARQPQRQQQPPPPRPRGGVLQSFIR